MTVGNLNGGNGCGRCGQAVIRREDGLALEPKPHPEGVYRARGGIIAPLEAL